MVKVGSSVLSLSFSHSEVTLAARRTCQNSIGPCMGNSVQVKPLWPAISQHITYHLQPPHPGYITPLALSLWLGAVLPYVFHG